MESKKFKVKRGGPGFQIQVIEAHSCHIGKAGELEFTRYTDDDNRGWYLYKVLAPHSWVELEQIMEDDDVSRQ